MAWPTQNAWDQHLEDMNRRITPNTPRVSLVRIEGPLNSLSQHVRHTHPYWQLDICVKGGHTAEVEGSEFEIKEKILLFIPPGNWHTYHHRPRKREEGWTIKFAVERGDEKYPARSLGNGKQAERLKKWIIELTREGTNVDYPRRILLERLLEASIELVYGDLSVGSGGYSEFVRQIRMWVDQAFDENRVVKVDELARKNGCSSTYLNRVIKSELGIPLKVFIDQRRFDLARRILSQAGLNVSETAERMGFDDVFRFSRFFKRMCGVSPKEYLKQCHTPEKT